MKKQDFTVLKIEDLHPFPDNPFRLVEDGLLTWNALSPACGVLFGVMFVCMLVRLRRQKREEQEDAEA